ncbi:class II glutamine amidotransferase [Thermococcus sp. M39]|uniref:class II glutamine amidotransferase n=1 Tax=unclassified Thermococcus TaxID=2627626 RepID=UPI0014399BE3|nr:MULTISPECIES: class II glutamine amidotransferase [unclassified Thermococcus]NJE08665.1 class II glutamine amidotransferase [Thermococcus sp. M39]NJE13034.1 class II glutamine amidotransferase [Thermococcus sp. LS2]
MCRILFAVGEGKRVRPLLEALLKSSEHDPYKLARNKGSQHRDGWGYVLLKDDYVEHYRSESAIFEDRRKVNEVIEKLDGFVVFLAHTRAASQGEKNLFNVQPFAFSTKRGFIFWTMHNGDLDKDKLIEMGELNPMELKGASDSYTMGVYLCRFLEGLEKEHLLKRFREIKTAAKSLLNTATLLMNSEKEVRAFITAYMSDLYASNTLNYYYGRLLYFEGADIFAVVSSTFEQYSYIPFEEVENRTAFYVRIYPSEKKFEVEEIGF